MRRVLVSAIFSGVVLLAACGGGNKLSEGTVVDKWIDPGYTTYVNGTCLVWSGSGSTRFCTLYQKIPIDNPSEYMVQIEGTHEGKTIVEAHEVSSGYWNSVQDGDHWAKN